MTWSKSLCSVCRRPGHNKTSCPERKPPTVLKPVAFPTKQEGAEAFAVFYSIGERMTPLSPALRFIVLRALCAFYLTEAPPAEPVP